MSFPFDLHSAAVSDSHLPCRAHTMLWSCRSSQGHDTARPSRDGLWVTCPRLSSSSNHAEFHENCYQKHTKPPHNDPYLLLQRVVSAHHKKGDQLNCWTNSSDISGYNADFHEGHGTVGVGQGNGMGEARPQHAMCESALKVMWPCIMTNFLITNLNWCTNFSNLFLEWQLASRLRMELRSILIMLASCPQTCMTYNIAVFTVKNSWRWIEKLSETCKVSFQEQIWEISACIWFYYKRISVLRLWRKNQNEWVHWEKLGV
jgi:hypothetical protein